MTKNSFSDILLEFWNVKVGLSKGRDLFVLLCLVLFLHVVLYIVCGGFVFVVALSLLLLALCVMLCAVLYAGVLCCAVMCLLCFCFCACLPFFLVYVGVRCCGVCCAVITIV